jgi:hypothetical protein
LYRVANALASRVATRLRSSASSPSRANEASPLASKVAFVKQHANCFVPHSAGEVPDGAQRSAPMRAAYGRAAVRRRSRHAPTNHDELALAVAPGANDRRHLVGENAGKQRKVARAVLRCAKPIADRGLTFGQAVECTFQRSLTRPALAAARLSSSQIISPSR